MSSLEFVYITYIETTPEKLWHALTDGDFTERYWFGHRINSDWKVGSTFRFTHPTDPSPEGKVLISEPPKRLAYTWKGCSEDLKHERISRVTFDLEPRGTVVKLTVTHDNLDEGGKTFSGISVGWPMVIASLKSMLETGRPLPPELKSGSQEEKAHA
jgi:uncharacterized protein YndB with AHSA1/START domain